MNAADSGRFFGGPASVILLGHDRPLLNWVAYALASVTDPGFQWTDVRMKGELLGDLDPLKRGVIGPDRLTLVSASELAPDHARANIAVSAVIRDDETPENLQRVVDFLRLPERSQALLSRAGPGGGPRVVVLSNAHRLVGYYPVTTVGPLLRAIVSTGVIVIMTFADAPTDGRFAFDVVGHLEGAGLENWRQARLRIEKGLPEGPLRSGREVQLADLGPVAEVFARALG